MDFLYNILISPIVFIMENILNTIIPFTGYLGGIISLSFIVSIILITIKKLASKIQKKEADLQYIMYPALLELKQKYKGEEQFYKMKALYKKYNYHPIKSVRMVAGLAIQIPFFIGAYHLLSSYTPPNPLAFDMFNLTQPDALLLGINALPFLMAGVAIFIAHKQGIKNKMEKYGFAILFLILLYASPSALLIYWTMNLILSYIIEQVLAE